MSTEKSVKRKDCPEHVSNSRTKKSQVVLDRDKGGLRPSSFAGCRAYRKVLEKVQFDKDVTEGSRVRLLGESGNSSAPRAI